MKTLPQIVFLVGPTAVGKSRLSLNLAQQLNAEIVSCDAMLVYREVNVASDKPSAEDLKRVRHHAINLVSVEEEFDVARYRKAAIAAIDDIHSRGKLPLIVGGSGMYMTILLDGIFEGGGEDVQVRGQLQQEAREQGLDRLYVRLQTLDPTVAAKIHPNDERRIIRALEVNALTGQRISDLHQQRQGLWGNADVRVIALNRDRAQLYDRINARVEAMLQAGLIEEIQSLRQFKISRTAQSLIGLPEIGDYIDGKCTLPEAEALMQMNTRHYAKRQLTWFRRDKRLEWLMIESSDSEGVQLNKVERLLHQR